MQNKGQHSSLLLQVTLLVLEGFMGLSREMRLATRIAGIAICVLLCAGIGNAQSAKTQAPKTETTDVIGEYACTEARVAGKSVPCKSAPLSLKSDGHFEVQGREGEYLVTGTWVELNGTLLKSRAKIEAGHRIVFRFYNKKGLCEVIYERRVAELGKTKLS